MINGKRFVLWLFTVNIYMESSCFIRDMVKFTIFQGFIYYAPDKANVYCFIFPKQSVNILIKTRSGDFYFTERRKQRFNAKQK